MDIAKKNILKFIMKVYSYKKVSINEMKGWLREDIYSHLHNSFFDDPVNSILFNGGRVISESKWRWAGFFSLGDKDIFLKRDKSKGLIELLKYSILPSKGRREWFISFKMRKNNLPVAEPLGWLERIKKGFVRESYFVSEFIVSGIPLNECVSILKDGVFLSKIAKTLLNIHFSGIYHEDLHAGNLLWNGETIFVIDLHRVKLLKSLSLNQKLLNIASLFHSLRGIWEEKEQFDFIKEYFKRESKDINLFDHLRRIHLLMEKLQNRQWRSRTKRCIKESSEFSVIKDNGSIIYHQKNFYVDLIKKGLDEHLRIIKKEPEKLVKFDKKSIISCLKNGGKIIFIKQFPYKYLKDRLIGNIYYSKGLRAWIGGNGLKVRDISTIPIYALLERKEYFLLKDSFLFMESIPDSKEMDRYIIENLKPKGLKRKFIKEFAFWLASIHQKGIYHLDMKTCNILVRFNGARWEFYLLDLEDIRLDRSVKEKQLFRNLLQLNTSIPDMIKKTDRLRFFKEYLKFYPIVKEEKPFIKRLIKCSVDRGVVYMSSDGLVIENQY